MWWDLEKMLIRGIIIWFITNFLTQSFFKECASDSKVNFHSDLGNERVKAVGKDSGEVDACVPQALAWFSLAWTQHA